MPKYREINLETGSESDVTIDEIKDFKGSGGEKNVFIKGGKAFGIYHDPKNVMPVEKCRELSVLTHPGIIKPIGLVMKSRSRVGESTMAVHNPWTLCSLFTMAFRNKHRLDVPRINDISAKMNDIVKHAHSHSIWIVDNNENNWLLSDDFQDVFAIDTGNWQTKSFPSQFIMLNIRDPFNPAGSKADWYAQAILLANMYIGKHPFEAAHPKYDAIPRASIENGVQRRPRMETMMRDKIAFFDPACTLNRACFPIDSIPAGLRSWMRETLMGDLRCEPPKDFGTVAAVQKIVQVHSTHKFQFDLIFTAVGDIFRIVHSPIKRIVLADGKWYVGQQAYDYPKEIKNRRLVHAGFDSAGDAFIAWIDSGRLKLSGEFGPITCSINATDLISLDGRVIAVNHHNVMQINVQPRVVLPEVISQIIDMPHATKVYEGCIVQNVLESWRVTFFPRTVKSVTLRIEKLEKCGQIVDAKYENGVLMILGKIKNTFTRYVYFDSVLDGASKVREDADIDRVDMNWTVNDRRTLVEIPDDGKLLASKAMLPYNGKVTEFLDSAITSDMSLVAEGNKTLMFLQNQLFTLTAK